MAKSDLPAREGEKRLVRPRDDRMIAGVCAGLARYFGWPADRMRLAYVILSVLSAAFPGLLVYFLLWFLMPEPPRERHEFHIRPPGE